MRKLQSAMEYLMTYGWAILAIAIVMVSLYSLGIFNAGSLKPTATPGSCQVMKTAAQTSLAGQCSNLIPKYVGQFGPGTSASISSPSSALALTAFTVSLWIKVVGPDVNGQYMLEKGTSNANQNYNLILASNGAYEFEPSDNLGTQHTVLNIKPSSGNYNDSRWHSIVITCVSNGNAYLYIDGVQVQSNSVSFTIFSGSQQLILAQGANGETIYVANVQIYNASLDNATAKALYLEGIGGVPVDPNHLAGWWPLNGNANDYSGNNNQGAASKAIWNANWQSGYSAPTS
ncbi:MAG: LamG domain-containing protein [Candidatus Micrarchaeota archaeon]|nr:LamG domain-containing protein [Candidatus Micrarchaeota archaeon]